MKTKNILVSGSVRSGSTWVGKVISQNANVDNIIEPLNLNRIKRFKKFKINNWFVKVDDTASSQLKVETKKLYDFYIKTTWFAFLKHMFQTYEGHNIIKSFKKKLRRTLKPVKLIKDPLALFSISWLVKEYGIKPLVLVRHPAAYVLSVKEKEWWISFDDLLKQEHFFEGELQPLKEELIEYNKNKDSKTIIENAALMWKVCYFQVLKYKENYPEWYYVKHETLSEKPIEEYKKIFNYFELDFTPEVEDYIVATTKSKEKKEHSRDASKNAIKWKHKLSEEEKRTIYDIVKEVSDEYYETFV